MYERTFNGYFIVKYKNKEFSAKTITDIKVKASKLANNNYDVIDKIEVWAIHPDGFILNTFTMHRFNRKMPNNTIKRGVWY